MTTLGQGALQVLQAVRATRAIGRSGWRQRRLLILCYHGLAIDDEHRWSPELYMTADHFRSRLRRLQEEACTVLPLDVAIRQLQEGCLPPRAVALTFDDGMYDFFRHAFPLLREFGFPATVYQTTFHCDFQRPIFEIALEYVLWRGRERTLAAWPEAGILTPVALNDAASRAGTVAAVVRHCAELGLDAGERDRLLAEGADRVGEEYGRLRTLRLLHLMTPGEIQEVRRAGVSIELHTHRHRTPMDETLFRREIAENRDWLRRNAGVEAPRHFCYPSGVYHAAFLPWLRAERVATATTCVPGLASRESEPLLLPRFVDTSATSESVFAGWLHGAGHLVRRAGGRAVSP